MDFEETLRTRRLTELGRASGPTRLTVYATF